MQPKRKIIQITSNPTLDARVPTSLFALCDDGEVFEYFSGNWRLKLPPIPQPEDSEVKE